MAKSNQQNRGTNTSNFPRKFATGNTPLMLALAAAAAFGASTLRSGAAYGTDVTAIWNVQNGSWDTASIWSTNPSTGSYPMNGTPAGDVYNVSIPLLTIGSSIDLSGLPSPVTIGSLSLPSTGTIVNGPTPQTLIIDPASLSTEVATTVSGNIFAPTGEINLQFGAGSTVSQNATVTGSLEDNLALTVDEPNGIVTLTGTGNTYTGGTTVVGGTLDITGPLATTGALTVNGGIFELDNGGQTVAGLGGTGGTVSLTSGSLTVSNGGNFAGAISGSGGLTISGGTEVLSGTNTYTGGTTVNSGTLSIASDSNLGATSGGVALGGGTLNYTGTGAVTISNAISTSGTGTTSVLENSGSGTETLTGSITNATAGNILAFSGGTFNLNEAGSGAGTFEIGDAPSTVIVSNANAFGSGAIIVNSGSTLETSSALAGSGSVLAITGSSYTQNSGSTLKLLATGNGVNDSIQLGNGTASLNGELNLIFSGFTPAAGQHYTVIGTTGTVSGTFSSLVLTGAPSLLKGTANYIAGTGEVIDLSNLAYFANLSGFTPNQASVATYLNNNAVSSSTPGTIQNAMVALSSMSQQQQANYLNELTPQAYSDLPQQSIQNNTFMAQQVFNQVQNAFDSGGFNTSGLTMLKTNDQDPFAVSMDAALASAQQQAQNSVAYMDNSPQLVGMPGVGPIVPSQESPLSNLSGFVLGTITVDQLQQNNTPTQHFTTGSVMAGLDYRLNRNLVIGGLFNWGYTGGTMDNVGSRQRSSSYTPGVFVGYKQGGFYADGLMSYTYNSYQINRSVNMPGSSSIATGEPDSNEYDANALVGYYLPLARGFQAGPAAGVGFTQINMSGFHETGSPFDLTVAKQHADSLRSLLGMQALYSFAPENNPLPISINFNAFWQHEFLDSSRDINAGFTQLGGGNFIYNTAGPSRDSALLGLGASGYINQQISLFVNYETQVGDHRQFAQTVMAGVAVSF